MVCPVRLRQLAVADAEAAIDHYGTVGGSALAGRFVDALERCLAAVGRDPASGSPRLGALAGLQGVRTKRLQRFPWLVCYVHVDDVAPGEIHVLRMLHERRDLPRALMGPENA